MNQEIVHIISPDPINLIYSGHLLPSLFISICCANFRERKSNQHGPAQAGDRVRIYGWTEVGYSGH